MNRLSKRLFKRLGGGPGLALLVGLINLGQFACLLILVTR